MEEFFKNHGVKNYGELHEKVKADAIFAVNLVDELFKEKFAVKEPVEAPKPMNPEAVKPEEKK